jgi:hypothetical protein
MSRSQLVPLLALVAAGCLVPFKSAMAGGSIAPACESSSVRVTDYNTWVGAGNVNDLYWIRNLSRQACSIRGYVRVSFIGIYGFATRNFENPHALTVQVEDSRNGGANGNDSGGVKSGPIPTVTLAPRGVASFWIYGTDEAVHLANGQLVRCITSYRMLAWLPGSDHPDVVAPMPENGFYWCGGIDIHPVVEGESGTNPPKPLSDYFGTPH